jgi:hypothetical protein
MDPACISVGQIPLLKNQRIGLIDSDTPKSALTKKSFDGRTMHLVVSCGNVFVDTGQGQLTQSSFPTSSTEMVGPSMMATMRTGRR